MCGILGSINILIDHSHLDLIKHRGPDDSGIESFIIDNNLVRLAHRRLSIVDLSVAGHQPMISDCHNYAIIFNGEIYNHLELKRALPKTINFKGHSDTETILYYIREFGIDSIKDFNGIFGLAYLDLSNKLLYLARDRFGVKPLYYSFQETNLLFSSELGPIREVLEPEIDLGAIGYCLKMRYFPAPLTPFENIYKLEAGQLMTIEIKPEKLCVCMRSIVKTPKQIGTRRAEYSFLVKLYGDLFEKAVERQLMADVNIGILLSGGVDSALVAAIAKAKSSKKVTAFTVGFGNTYSRVDETRFANETSEILGIGLYSRECNFHDFLGSLKRIVAIVEEPIATTSMIPMYFLSELASSKVKVVLSGQGADEPLGGYFKYKALPFIAAVRRIKIFRSLFRLIGSCCHGDERVQRLAAAIFAKDEIQSYMDYSAISSFNEIFELVNPANQRVFMRDTLKKQKDYHRDLIKKAPGESTISDLFLYFDLRTSLADDLLMYSDKITMHFGLECRVPILDNDLIEFVESLHSSYKFNAWSGKLIHKSFARSYLPSSIIERKKNGFNSPTEAWFRENSGEIVDILSSNSNFKALFSIDKIVKLIDVHAGGVNLEKQIFLLLAIYSFIDQVYNPIPPAKAQLTLI